MSIERISIGTEAEEIEEIKIKLAERVKTSPHDVESRLKLIKFHCLQSNWDSALQQLQVLQKIDPATLKQCELFNNLIYSERMRVSVLLGEREAGSIKNEQPDWVYDLQKANALYASGQFIEGEQVRGQCIESANAQSGNSSAIGDFKWLADGDDRLGPICEFISAGAYRWVPITTIQSLLIVQPQGISDLIWAPAEIVVDEQTWKGYLPARYPLTNASEHSFKIGSKTVWHKQDGGRYIGFGRKMWICDRGEYSLFEMGNLTFSKQVHLQ